MAHEHSHHVSNEERREFLKVLGVAGSVAAGGATLDQVRQSMSGATTEELAPVGQAIASDLAGELDPNLLASGQSAMADAAVSLETVAERGIPTDSPGDDFAAVAEAGRPVYEHLTEVGFFESTTEELPEFTPSYLESAVESYIGSEALTDPLAAFGMSDGEGVDLLAEVVANAEELSQHHWIATDEIPRAEIEFGQFIPPMTQGAAGGSLLWLEDLDKHLWQKEVLLTDEIVADAVWHGQSMAAGFHLMTEGAKAIAAENEAYSDTELAALLSTGFAVQAIAQGLLPQDVYWVTDSMRGQDRPDIRVITE